MVLKKTFNRFKFSKLQEQEKSQNYKEIVTLSYLPDVSEILNFIKQNIKVCTNSVQTIKQILPNLKHQIKPKQQQESNL